MLSFATSGKNIVWVVFAIFVYRITCNETKFQFQQGSIYQYGQPKRGGDVFKQNGHVSSMCVSVVCCSE